MAEAATAEAEMEPANSKPDTDVAKMDNMADADGGEGDGGADATGPAPTHKTPATAKRAKAKRFDVEPDKIVTGLRQRKSVDLYKVEDIHVTEKLTVEPGKGTKLSSIPNVAFKLSKLKARDKLAEMIHTLLFKRKGEVMKRKRDIGEFSGFVFTDDERQKEGERASEYLHRFTTDALHQFMDILDLPRGADKKEGKVKRVLEFLETPSVMSQKDLAAQNAKKKAAVKRKRESKLAKAGKAAKAEDEEEADEHMDDAEGEDEEEEEEEQPEEKPKPKRAAKSKSKGKAAATKPKTASKGSKKTAAAQEEVKDEDDEDDDMPLAAAAKKAAAPSDRELVTAVEEILAGEDVQSFNIKDLMRRLKEKYMVDLAKQKPIIKATAIRYCQEHAPAADEVEEADGAVEEDAAADDEDTSAPEMADKVVAEEGQPGAADNGDLNHEQESGAEDAEEPDAEDATDEAAKVAKQDAAAAEAALAAGNGEEPQL